MMFQSHQDTSNGCDEGRCTSTLRRSAVQAKAPTTELSLCDTTAVAIATCRAMFFKGKVFDDDLLGRTLSQVASDIPMLAGRVKKLNLPIRWSMSDIAIQNSNIGIEFRVLDAPEKSLDDCGPQTWVMEGITISKPNVPFYMPFLDSGMKLLKGEESLCKVQLTHLKDGDVLGVSMSHMMTDGVHWPYFMTHLAARYREISSGTPLPRGSSELLSWNGDKQVVSFENIKQRLVQTGSIPSNWTPKPFPIRARFFDHFRALSLLFRNEKQKVNFNIVSVPRSTFERLKGEVQKIISQTEQDLIISTGDIVQGVASMMVHGSQGKPLLPLSPKTMVVLVQIPGMTSSGDNVRYFGNSVHPMSVRFTEEELKTVPTTQIEILAKLAAKIRQTTMALKSDPTTALQSLYETQQVVETPIWKSLAFLAGNRFPYVTCTTNYIGSLKEDKELDFGFGAECKSSTVQWLVTPLARDMAVIRPSAAPYPEGLFFHMTLSKIDSQQLRELALFQDLLPEATFL